MQRSTTITAGLATLLAFAALASAAEPAEVPSATPASSAASSASVAPASEASNTDAQFPAPVKAVSAGPDVRPAPAVQPDIPSARPIDRPLFQDDEEFPAPPGGGIVLGSPMFDMDWFTVDGGGTTFHTGGSFELAGTTGQADSGVLIGGNFTLTGGFWGRVRMDECLGDADGNGVVNFADITSVLANWLDFGASGDANNDWFVDFQDITIVLANWGATCP